jgi:tRNA/rRNA methyltransferase
MGENIGAVARSMKNFGLEELRIIDPRDGWPNAAAISTSAHAADIIENAKVFPSFEEAISDLNFLYATTARNRYMNKPAVTSREMAAEINTNIKTGIVFGPERTGLVNEEVVLCNKIVTIPISDKFPSINISHAAAIIFYELFITSDIHNNMELKEHFEAATQSEILGFFEHIENSLTEKEFFKVTEKKPGMISNIRNIFMRITNLSGQDIRTLRGIINSLTR